MNREILFRGKCVNDDEWVTGDLISNYEEYRISVFYQASADSEREVICMAHIVDKDTICQYTGLKDKNGNDIFEGDIVRIPYRSRILENILCKVVFKDGEYVGEILDGNGEESIARNDIEIVGNIFDNPELLKVATNEIKLKPCPFCGGNAELHENVVYADYAQQGHFYVSCNNCGARTVEIILRPYFYGDNPMIEGHRKKACDLWNRRCCDGQI